MCKNTNTKQIQIWGLVWLDEPHWLDGASASGLTCGTAGNHSASQREVTLAHLGHINSVIFLLGD